MSRLPQHRALTLVETLAAIALLAIIAVACARLLQPARASSPDSSHAAAAGRPIPGAATVLAAILIYRPADLGVPNLAQVPHTPARLAPTAQTADRLRSLGIDAREAHAWLVPIPHPHSAIVSAGSPGPSTTIPPRPDSQGSAPHWLIVQLADDIAVRCVQLPPRRSQ